MSDNKQDVRESAIVRTAGEFLDLIEKLVDQHGRDKKIVISVPYRDNIGWHYENIKNTFANGNSIEICTTVPEHDDVRKTHA